MVLTTGRTHSWRRKESLWSGWTPPHTALPCWAGLFACRGDRMGVFLYIRCLLRLPLCCSFPQPFALWSSGLGSAPGAAGSRPGGDSPVGVLFLSRWSPGLDHHGPRTENHVVSDVKDERKRYGTNQNKARDRSIWSQWSLLVCLGNCSTWMVNTFSQHCWATRSEPVFSR